MSTQLELAKSAKEHLSANHPSLAVNILEKLAMELSHGEFQKQSDADQKVLADEIGRLRLLAVQGTEFYGKWLSTVAPNGDSYTCYGTPSTEVSEHSAGFRLGTDLRA